MNDTTVSGFTTSEERVIAELHGRIKRLQTSKRELVEALDNLLSTIQVCGEWDDGCFYFKRVAAPELEIPLGQANAALKAAGEEK